MESYQIQTGVTLRMNIKLFVEEKLSHELLLIIKQRDKSRNAFENSMLADMKLSEMKTSKKIQSSSFFRCIVK